MNKKLVKDLNDRLENIRDLLVSGDAPASIKVDEIDELEYELEEAFKKKNLKAIHKIEERIDDMEFHIADYLNNQ